MAISLKKGQGVSLKKTENDLSSVTVGLGWDIADNAPKGLLGSLFGKKEAEYDLDAVAFLCGPDGKVHDLGQRDAKGQPTLVGGDIVFFNSLAHASGHLRLTGDNRTGAGAGDDEQIVVRLDDLADRYARVVFIVQIYGGKSRNQDFSKVRSAFIRAVDGKGREMARFDLSGGDGFATACSLLFAELVREPGGWKFHAIGTPSPSDTFVDWLKKYL